MSTTALPKIKAQDTAMIMYTSGTGSEPKGVIYTHQQIVASVGAGSYVAVGALDHRKPADVPGRSFLAYLPLAHIFEFSQELLSLSLGWCINYGSPTTLTDASPCVVPGELGDLRTGNPFYLILVPRLVTKIKSKVEKKMRKNGMGDFFNYVVDYKTHWVERGYRTPILDMLLFDRIKCSLFGSNLGLIFVASALFPEEDQRFLRAIVGQVSNAYGATEGGCITGQMKQAVNYNDVGPCHPYAKIILESWVDGGYKVTDKQGPSGEILFGGPHVAEGYLNLDNGSFFRDTDGLQWFRTGDIGRFNLQTQSISVIDR